MNVSNEIHQNTKINNVNIKLRNELELASREGNKARSNSKKWKRLLL